MPPVTVRPCAFGNYTRIYGVSAMLKTAFVRCVLACSNPVAVRLKVPHPSEMGGLNRIAEDYLRRVLGLGSKERHC
jgi:hypothetical protein